MEKLLESKTKNKLLMFFTARPERNFYLGEIRRKVKASRIISELISLSKQGVLVSYSKKGNKYFRLNRKGKMYKDIKEWAKKFKRKGEDEALRILKKLSGLKMVVLTGLFSGQRNECDILLVGDISKKQLKGFEKSFHRLMGQEINYAVMKMQEFRYRKDTFDRFMKDIFENEHIVLIDKTK